MLKKLKDIIPTGTVSFEDARNYIGRYIWERGIYNDTITIKKKGAGFKVSVDDGALVFNGVGKPVEVKSIKVVNITNAKPLKPLKPVAKRGDCIYGLDHGCILQHILSNDIAEFLLFMGLADQDPQKVYDWTKANGFQVRIMYGYDLSPVERPDVFIAKKDFYCESAKRREGFKNV